MSIITALPGIKRSVVYPFCFFTLFGPYFHEIDHHVFRHIEFGSIWWPCLVVFRLHGIMLVFQASYSQICCDYFFFTPPTDPKPGNLFDAKRKKRGWPKPYGFFLGFLTTSLLRISVYLPFVLFFFCRWNNWNWNCSNTIYIPFGDSREKKMKNAMIYWPQGQWGGVRAR